MGMSSSDYLINWEHQKFTNSLYLSKDSINNRFLTRDHRTNTQKNFCNNIFRTLESLLLAENLSKDTNFAYNYILENFDEDIKWEWGSLENNYNMCAGISFFLDRKYGIFARKSTLAKILGIEISSFHKVIDILKEISYFKSPPKFSEKKENLFEIIDFNLVFGVSLKQKKPPKEIDKQFQKSHFFPFFLFYVFALKIILIIIIDILSVGKSKYIGEIFLKSKFKIVINSILSTHQNYSSKLINPLYLQIINFSIGYYSFKCIELKVGFIDFFTGENQHLKKLKIVKKIKKNEIWKILSKIDSKIKKSRKMRKQAKKRIYTQPILEFEKNQNLSNISSINSEFFFLEMEIENIKISKN